MGSASHDRPTRPGTSERLLLALAEQLKLPLLQIARHAELGQITSDPLEYISTIETTAGSALQFIDSYLLSNELLQQPLLQLEPVSVASVLNDTAHQLATVAREYECGLELHLSGRYEPVMAHRTGLQAALRSLGQVLIMAQSQQNKLERPVLKLAAHRSRDGVVAGLFAELDGLSQNLYQRAHKLYGYAHQPLANVTTNNSAGIFIAESLLSSMSVKLRVARHQHLSGLAATFLPTKQLALL